MKSLEQVVASMKSAADKFVAANSRQLIATLPKEDRPVRRTAGKATASTLQESLDTASLLPMAVIRKHAAHAKTLQVVREGTTVKLVQRKTKRVVATVTVELGPRGRTLTAKLEDALGNLRPFGNSVHSYGRTLRYDSMLSSMEVDRQATLAEQTRRVRAYIHDDIEDLVDAMVTSYAIAQRAPKFS